MALEKKTVLDLITTQEDGSIQVRMQKQVVMDGELLKQEYHRTLVDPLGDVDTQFDLVNAHLDQLGYGPVSETDLSMVRTVTEIHRSTLDVAARIEALRVQREAEEAQRQAEQAAAEAEEPA